MKQEKALMKMSIRFPKEKELVMLSYKQWKIAKERKVIPEPIDDRKFQE